MEVPVQETHSPFFIQQKEPHMRRRPATIEFGVYKKKENINSIYIMNTTQSILNFTTTNTSTTNCIEC